MGLFGKKEKQHCPVCGNEMGFFSSTEVADGKICESCYNRYHNPADYEKHSVAYYKDLYDKEAEEVSKITEKFGKVSAILKVDADEILNLRALDVGIKNANTYNGHDCLRGSVVFGEFKKDCKVFGVHEGEKVTLDLLGFYKDKGDMGEVIAGSIGRNAKVGDYGNCIVADPQLMAVGDYIVAE